MISWLLAQDFITQGGDLTLLNHTSVTIFMSTSRRVGVDILLYRCLLPRPRQRQRYTTYKGNPCLNFLGSMFYVPQGIGFCFLLRPCPLLSRSKRDLVFHRNGFFRNLVKSTRGILIKRARKLHRQVAHDLIIVDLQLTNFCINCVVLKLFIL